jgi:hypothetical protein
MLNFNNAAPQKEVGDFSVIPNNSFVKVVLSIDEPKSEKADPNDKFLSVSAKNNKYITFTARVTQGKFIDNEMRYQMYTVDGSEKATNISVSFLRAVLESARGIDPNDTSPNAVSARQVKGWGDFEGIEFIAKVGIEPPKNGKIYNKIKKAVTLDMPEYATVKGGQDIISDEAIPEIKAAETTPAQSGGAPWGQQKDTDFTPPKEDAPQTNNAVPVWAR